jgi:hypothetical protein
MRVAQIFRQFRNNNRRKQMFDHVLLGGIFSKSSRSVSLTVLCLLVFQFNAHAMENKSRINVGQLVSNSLKKLIETHRRQGKSISYITDNTAIQIPNDLRLILTVAKECPLRKIILWLEKSCKLTINNEHTDKLELIDLTSFFASFFKEGFIFDDCEPNEFKQNSLDMLNVIYSNGEINMTYEWLLQLSCNKIWIVSVTPYKRTHTSQKFFHVLNGVYQVVFDGF